MSERSLLADTVAEFFAARCTPEYVAEVEAGHDFLPLWNEVDELGFARVSVPEELGGSGGSLVDALTVLRAAGHNAVPLPLAETGALSGWVLAAAGLPLPDGIVTVAPVGHGDRLTIERHPDAGFTLHGRAHGVPWASRANAVATVAEDASGTRYVAIVDVGGADVSGDLDGLTVIPGSSLAGEPRDTLEFTGLRVETATVLPLSNLDVLARGALLRSAQMLGALERTRDLTVSWSQDREQFGRPISSFQAVQHMLAQMAREVAVTRAAVELAASAADGGGSALLEIASAKLVAGEAAGSVTAYAHQVHGAIGVTKEYSLSILTRRLWSWRQEFGSERVWAREIGRRAYASPDGVWGLVTSCRMPLGTARTA